ncbi:MAG: helix-turn-helix transcriptional regulator [Lachnospiraceae bacterium]|nr:helix-turn-helix transcriptional regulator [Lachnospiraceae bacterium]
MAYPIPAGYNFKVNHKKRDNHFSMATADVYNTMYGVGYMVAGDRLIITPDKTVVVHPGTIQFMHKNLFHRTTYISEGLYENIEIKFRESVIDHLIKVVGQDAFDMLYQQVNITLTPEANNKVRAIMTQIEEEWEHYDSYSNDMIESLVTHLFVTALRGQASAPASTPDTLLRQKHLPLLHALSYIQHHYAEDPSLEETAAAVHVSGAYLSRLFKQAFDTSYSAFLSEIKISHAQQLLLNTSLPVSQVAYQCGYHNSNYFCDAFKKVIGVPPLKYRKGQ